MLRFPPSLLTPLFSLALTSASLAGCAVVDDSPERGASRAGDGKADSLTPAQCAELAPRTDQHGTCRGADGRFAPAQCCAESAVCKTAFLDPSGTCRRSDNGQFAPASCCAAKCNGATLDAYGFCRAESGQFAPAACCADQCYAAQGPAGSCEAGCGDQALDGDCFCDELCAEFGDCCADKVASCGGNGNPVFKPLAGTCSQASCGEQSVTGDCFCDDACADFGDCCVNKASTCGGPGLFIEATLADCGPDECDSAALDAHGICRRQNGQFAKAACCTPPPACDTATVDAHGICRRTDNGQFAATVCCEGMCQDASLDAVGACRNVDGELAPKGCCANECFQVQQAPLRNQDVTGLPACS